jgi:hypothetical protein
MPPATTACSDRDRETIASRRDRPRRGLVLRAIGVVLLAGLLLAQSGCTKTKQVRLTRVVTVHTTPPGGEVFDVTGGGRTLLGRAPVTLEMSALATGRSEFDSSVFLYNPAFILLFPIVPLLPEAYRDTVEWSDATEARKAGARDLMATLGARAGTLRLRELGLPREYEDLVETVRPVTETIEVK